jgi:hypothetical protein
VHLMHGGGHGDENREGRVRSGLQRRRWWVVLDTKCYGSGSPGCSAYSGQERLIPIFCLPTRDLFSTFYRWRRLKA